MSNRRQGPTCPARESEGGLHDLAQSLTEPIDIGAEPGRNPAGRKRGADVADVEDDNERQNLRRKRNRAAVTAALKAQDEAAQAIFRGNMSATVENARSSAYERTWRVRSVCEGSMAPPSIRTRTPAPARKLRFSLQRIRRRRSLQGSRRSRSQQLIRTTIMAILQGGSQHGLDAPSSGDDAEGRTAGQPGHGDTHPLPSDKATGVRARRRGGHAPKAAGGDARALVLGDPYDEGTFAEVCSKYATETDECGVLAAAKRQPENPSHRSSRLVSEEFLTATEYVFLYLSAQTAAARCPLCDELVVANAKRHVELATGQAVSGPRDIGPPGRCTDIGVGARRDRFSTIDKRGRRCLRERAHGLGE
jgi:hypothetical protein